MYIERFTWKSPDRTDVERVGYRTDIERVGYRTDT
jgi:hypothetical protein